MTDIQPLSADELIWFRKSRDDGARMWENERRMLATIDTQSAEITKLRGALVELADWPDGGNRYGQDKMKKRARAALEETR